MAGTPSPFTVNAATSDGNGGLVLSVGINPAWVEGFSAGVNACLAELLAASDSESDPEEAPQ